MRFLRSLSLISLLLLGATALRAQSVRWQPDDSGQPGVVALVFEQCEPDGDPQLPTVAGATLAPLGRSTNMNMTNFRVTRTVVLTYQVRVQRAGPIAIPTFDVKTDKGTLRVPAYTVGAAPQAQDALTSSKFQPERTTVWAGEVFALNYSLYVSRRNSPQPSSTFEWNAAPFVAEDWSKPELNEVVLNGENRIQVLFRTRALAKAPGTVQLDAATHNVTVQVGTVPFGGFPMFQSPRFEHVPVVSDQPTIQVKPLPPAPAGFGGAVGQFTLTSKVVPQKATVGEPVTWTLELKGTGNWPDIAGLPARDVSRDFQAIQPKAKRTPAEGKLFDATLTEDVVLVPSKPGTYTLGPISMVVFNPKTGAYETKRIEATILTIGAATASKFSVAPSPAAATPPQEPPPPEPSQMAPAEPRQPVAPAPSPSGLPRDPLPGIAEARAPLSRTALAGWLALPGAALLGLWLGLAARRARQTDPARPRREARERLARTLSHLSSAPEPERPPLLLAWQRDTRVLWQLPQAAPSAAAFRAELGADAAIWATLWAEADRALYGPRPALPSDWVARAQEALLARRVPGFRVTRIFLPPNLLPFAAVVVAGCFVSLVAIAAEKTAPAQNPAAAYAKGEFAAAEQGWRQRLSASPTDWIARHNLSLALAQQERNGEAAGQAVAAFVQHPGTSAVRWHFALAAEKLGATPPDLAPFVTPGPLHELGRLMSPADWQRTLIASAWVAALGLGLWLWNGYSRRSFRLALAGLVGCGLAVLAAGAAVAGVESYGLAAHADAVVVVRAGSLHSIPTEADTTQKTTPVAAGAMAIVDQEFLGWNRLAFENGQTGWLRREEFVRLWK